MATSFIMVTLLMPFAQAQLGLTVQPPIVVDDQDHHTRTFTGVSSSQYSFQFSSDFDLTHNATTSNLALVKFLLFGYINSADVSDTTKDFSMTYLFNQTHSATLQSHYEKQNFLWVFTRWAVTHTVILDGTPECTFTYTKTFGDIRTEPEFVFQFTPTNSIPNGTYLNATNLTNKISFLVADSTGELGTQAFCSGSRGTGFGNNSYFANGVLNGPITAYLNVSDQILYNNVFSWQATNAQTHLARLNDGIFNGTTPAGCKGIDLIITCFNPLDVLAAGSTLVANVLLSLFNYIPGGSIIGEIISLPFQLLSDSLKLLSDLFLHTNSPYGFAGIYWMLTIYMLSLGFAITSITGNPTHIIATPYLFLKGTIMAVVSIGYVVFIVIPRAAMDIGTKLLQAAINLFRG